MIVTAERAVVFSCNGDALLGIVHVPTAPAKLGVLVIVGGPQYRAGSHRQFVLLARAVAESGFAVLRFDVRGMGDSEGGQRGFEDIASDIATAIDAFQAQVPSVRRVMLWGLCDGASAALLYADATRDQRIAGVCAANPWVSDTVSLARTHLKHYYVQRVTTVAFWTKLIRGHVSIDALRDLSRKICDVAIPSRRPRIGAVATYPERMARACETIIDGSILILLSDDDYTAKEFVEVAATSLRWQRVLRMGHVQQCVIEGADHTFSQAAACTTVHSVTIRWLNEMRSREPHFDDAAHA